MSKGLDQKKSVKKKALKTPDEKRAEKRAKKAELFAQLKADLGTKRELNNATVFGFKTYDTGGPAFSRLLDRCNGDVREFLAAVRKLDGDSFPEPQTDDFNAVIDQLQP